MSLTKTFQVLCKELSHKARSTVKTLDRIAEKEGLPPNSLTLKQIPETESIAIVSRTGVDGLQNFGTYGSNFWHKMRQETLSK